MGVKIMNLDENSKIVKIAKVRDKVEGEAEETEETQSDTDTETEGENENA
jgi:hypothetical protein